MGWPSWFSRTSPSTRTVRLIEPQSPALAPVDWAARKNGLRLARGSDWDVLWSYRVPWNSAAYLHRTNRSAPYSSPPPFVINHLPGTYALASKKMLHEFVANLTARQPQLFGGGALTPETFALPEQRAALERRLAARGAVDAAGWPNWLSKAKTHRGVRALRSADASSLAALGAALVQERVRPLLLPSLRRAFDIGLYVVVSSVRPLRVYAHDVALVRFCEAEYPQTPAQFAEASRFVVKEYTPIWELRATFGADLARCGGAAACALRRRLQAEGWDADALWRRMERAAAALLAELRPAVEARLRAQRLRSDIVFELFRFDFLVDERARPVLTEVNISPNMVGRVPEDAAAKERLLRDTLRGRPRPPRPASVRRRRARAPLNGAAAGCCALEAPCAASGGHASPPRRRARSRRRRPRRRSTAGAAARRRPTTTSRRRCGARRRGATPSCAACCAEGHRDLAYEVLDAPPPSSAFVSSAPLGHRPAFGARARAPMRRQQP